MDDCPPLPLSEGGDDDAFFSDLCCDDEPHIFDNTNRSNRRLVIDAETERRISSIRENPFSTRNYVSSDESSPQQRILQQQSPRSHRQQQHQQQQRSHTASSVSTVPVGRNLNNDGLPVPISIGSDHCHIPHKHEVDNTVRNQLIAISIFTTAFMIGEGIGGYFAGSLAVATDVMHLASDLLSFFISLVAIHLAKRKVTQRLSWGYYRAEILGALLSVLIIWVVTAVLVYLAIERIVHSDYGGLVALDMVITASCGVAFNVIMALILNVEIFKCKVSHGHSHSVGGHGHSHAMTPASLLRRRRRSNDHEPLAQESDGEEENETGEPTESNLSGRREKNIVIRAAFVHVLGDLLQSIGVLVASLIIYFHPDAKVADPICTFIFSVLVMITTFTVVRDSLFILMEGVPKKISYDELRYQLLQLSGVMSVHSLRIWSLTSNEIVACVHIAVDDGADYPEILKKANKIFRDDYLIPRTTIQVEPYDEQVMAQCTQCNIPEVQRLW